MLIVTEVFSELTDLRNSYENDQWTYPPIFEILIKSDQKYRKNDKLVIHNNYCLKIYFKKDFIFTTRFNIIEIFIVNIF
jgi:hypothetical protein